MNVMILFGGKSVEHEVSILTAYQMMEKIPFPVVPIYVSKNQEMFYVKDLCVDDYKDLQVVKAKGKKVRFEHKGLFCRKFIPISCAIILMHGTHGEDGMASALMEFYEIPYVGSHYIDAGVMQDKGYMKDILSANQIPILPYLIIRKGEESKLQDFEFPLIIKPCDLGSSIGISVVHNEEELAISLKHAFSFGEKVIVEKYVLHYREMNLALLGDYEHQIPSKIEEVSRSNEILDYNDKYQNKQGLSKRILPAIIEENLEKEIIDLGIKTAQLFNSSGVVRIDFIIYESKPYVNEINSVPGSLAYYLYEEDFDLITKLIKNAYKREYHNTKKNHSFTSNILSSKGIKK